MVNLDIVKYYKYLNISANRITTQTGMPTHTSNCFVYWLLFENYFARVKKKKTELLQNESKRFLDFFFLYQCYVTQKPVYDSNSPMFPDLWLIASANYFSLT